jgi:hypothetical protein
VRKGNVLGGRISQRIVGMPTVRRESPVGVLDQAAFALYLAALVGFGFKWLSPLSALSERAIWSDVLVAAAGVSWFAARVRPPSFPRLRAFHLALGLFLAAGALSMAFAANLDRAGVNLLLMLELGVLAVLTSEFASDRKRLNAIVLAICFVSLYTAVLAIIGLALFYAGVDSSLLWHYGDLTPSDAYARVAAGFYSAPLLASFCIFASAVVARDDAEIPRRLRLATQIALAMLVLSTFSRAILGFAAAIAIRAGYRNRDSRRVRFAVVAFVVASVATIGALTVGFLRIDPTHLSDLTYEVAEADNPRRAAVSSSFDSVTEHPIVGKGPGLVPGSFQGDPIRAHLTPLNIAATLGLPALGAAIFLIITLWRNRKRPIPIATWSGMAGLGIEAMAGDVEHFRNVWVMIGVADADRRRPP